MHARVLFGHVKPIEADSIEKRVAEFSQSYKDVVKEIIDGSAKLSPKTFRSNVATLMPSFGMTRRGAFHGLKIENGIIEDPNKVIDRCWNQAKDDLKRFKDDLLCRHISSRSRALLELSTEPEGLFWLAVEFKPGDAVISHRKPRAILKTHRLLVCGMR